MSAIQSELALWCEWGEKGLSLGTELCSCPALCKSLPLSSHCTEGWGEWSLYFRAQAGIPYWSPQPGMRKVKPCEKAGSLSWPHSSAQGSCQPMLSPAWWGAESSTGLQTLLWVRPEFSLNSAQVMHHCSRCEVLLQSTPTTMMGWHHHTALLSQTLRPQQQPLSTTTCGEW